MTTRFFRNKRNKTKKIRKMKLKAGASKNKYKHAVVLLQQQNSILKNEISTQNAINQTLKRQVQTLKGQNSVYSSTQTTRNSQIQNENANMVKVLNDINKSQQKILKLLDIELSKKSPDMNQVNKLVGLNQVSATGLNEIVSKAQPVSETPSSPSVSPSPSSSSAVPVAAVTGVAAGVVLNNAVQENSGAANDLVTHLSNAAGSIASPENIQAASDAAQRTAKATGKVLADENVQKHAINYGNHVLNGAMDTGAFLHKAINGKATSADVASTAGKLTKHGLHATSAAVQGLFSAYKASKTPSPK